MKKTLPISATLLTKNSERYLAQILDSLQYLDEILLLDNSSNDSTLAIAQRYPNCRIEKQPEFLGFGKMKNLAASYARNDWIFNIDSDEIPDTALQEALKQIDLSNTQQIFSISRLNHYRGRAIKACTWYPDILPRIYHRQHTHFSDSAVHERLLLAANSTTTLLTGQLLHYSFTGITDLINKTQFYTDLFATERQYQQRATIWTAIRHSLFAWIKNYLLKRGFLYGRDGFVIANNNALNSYLKYIKLAETNQRLGISLIITNHNRPKALMRSLESALQQNLLPQEILITDINPNKETQALIQTFAAKSAIPIHYLWHENQKNYLSHIRNHAIAIAQNDYIVMIDDNLILHPNFLRDHQYAAQKGIFIQGSHVLLNQALSETLLTQKIQSPFKRPFYAKGIQKRHAAISCSWLLQLTLNFKNQNLNHTTTCNIGFFRSDALAVNGFNHQFLNATDEVENEFIARLYHHGVKRSYLHFGAIAYQLYTPQSKPVALPQNNVILTETLEQRKTWCQHGINEYLIS